MLYPNKIMILQLFEMSVYLPMILTLCILFFLYKFFLSFFITYLIAGYKLGFNNIAFLYRPLSSYSTLYKQSVKKYKHTLGHIKAILSKNPDVKIIFIRLFGITHLTIVDPEYIRKMSFQYLPNLHKRQLLIFYKQIEHGLVFAEDELWKKSRKLMSNMFHFNILESRSNIMEEVVVKQIKELDLQKPDLFKLGCSIGGEIVLKSLFGSDYYNVDFDGRNPFEQINELMLDLLMTSRGIVNMIRIIAGVQLDKNSRFMTDRERKCLNRLNNFKSKSKQYLKSENQSYKNGEEVTQFLKAYFDLDQLDVYEETVQQLFLFLLAGQDTTGALISSSLLCLSQHPKYQNTILQDVKKNGLHNSKQLNNFINQVNRKHAPVQNTFTRKVIKQFSIDGYTFKANTPLTFGIHSTMNNVKYWDDPDKFIPERFNEVENPNAYIPFSSGPRNCIGQHMAMMEVRLTIVKVLEKYRLEEDGDTSIVINRGVVNLPLNQHSVRFHLKKELETY